MIDDQDRCEWVNVSSGTSSPRYSWTKGHKMVVVDKAEFYFYSIFQMQAYKHHSHIKAMFIQECFTQHCFPFTRNSMKYGWKTAECCL